MTIGRIGGLVIIIGSLIFMFAAAPMSKIYGPQDIEGRMALLNANRPAYVFSQLLFAIGAAVTAAGFVVMSPRLRPSASPDWLPALASTLLLLGTASWLLFVYQRAVNPEVYFQDYARVPWNAWAYLVLTALALLIFGLVFLQSGFPRWIAYFTVIVIGLLTAGAIFIPEWLPPQLTYLLTLVIGVAVVL
jgi:hypothetical protein